MAERDPRYAGIATAAIAFEGGIAILAIALAWAFRLPLTDQLQVTSKAIAIGVVETVPLLLLSWWCLHSRLRPISELTRTVKKSVVPLFAQCSVGTLAIISLLAGLGEEMLFRGVLQGILARWLGVLAALATTSVLFGLAHFVTSWYAILAGVIGVYLGVLALVHQNLVIPIVAHALYDFLALLYVVSTMTPASEPPPLSERPDPT